MDIRHTHNPYTASIQHGPQTARDSDYRHGPWYHGQSTLYASRRERYCEETLQDLPYQADTPPVV